MRRFLPLLAAFALACQQAPVAPASAETPASAASQAARPAEVDVAELKAALERDGTHLIDVRTPQEYADGHVPGAVNIPLDQLGQRLGELPKDGTLYVICRSGHRSGLAQKELAGKGIEAINVRGGTLAWKAAGYPVE